jgi:predicted nucleic acid-binding protein
MAYLLDTNIISDILKEIGPVVKKVEKLVLKNGREAIVISGISYYEVKKGFFISRLGEKKLFEKLKEFELFCDEYKVALLDDIQIFERAAEIDAILPQGIQIELADLLITSVASHHELTLVSRDRKLLEKIRESFKTLTVEDWGDGAS